MIFWEPLRLLEATQLARWGGTRPEQTYIRIVDAEASDHHQGYPLTSGCGWCAGPILSASPGHLEGQGCKCSRKHLFGGDSAILAAEVGAELSNGQPARARTVFLFWHHDTFYLSTGEAAQLFDRAVDWALGLPSGDGA